MRYETIDGITNIWCADGESELDVLRAIANAAFETAGAVGMGVIQFDPNTILPVEFLEKIITLDDDEVLYMDYVQGRQVKTTLTRVEPGRFVLDNYNFERDRGAPDVMLNRAMEILAGADVTSKQLTANLFEGETLDRRANERYSIVRNPGESDWELRQRIFLESYDDDPDGTLSFVLGGTIGDYDELDMMLVLINANTFGTVHGRRRFCTGFAADPLVMRIQRMERVS